MCYDVGANIGLYAVFAANPGARAVAFEPKDYVREALHRKVALSERVVLRSVVLADFDVEASFTTDLEVGNHLRADDATNGDVTVAVRRLDNLVETDPLTWPAPAGERVLFLWIARDLPTKRGPLVMVEAWAGGSEVRQFIDSVGYRVYSHDESSRRLRQYPPDWAGQANFFAVRPGLFSESNRRLAQSSRLGAVDPYRILGWTAS